MTTIGSITGFTRSGATFDFTVAPDRALRVAFLSPHTARVRMAFRGEFRRTLPEKLGYVRESLGLEPEVAAEESDLSVTLQSGGLSVRVDKTPLRLGFLDAEGRLLTQGRTPSRFPWGPGATVGPGAEACLSAAPDEHFYGLGFQRVALDCRGKSLEWKRTFRHQSATVPFFLSTNGYGFYSNNTWPHTFDFTTVSSGCYTVNAAGGDLDFFLFPGPSFREILLRYTELTGRSAMAPLWAFGLLYICRYFETQEGVLAAADGYRRNDIPCDMIGLEPGWEEVPYEMSWRWSPERFPDPRAMIRALADRGFVLEMWESGKAPYTAYADKEARLSWYRRRLAASTDIGAKFFKQDDPYPRMIESEELQEPVLIKPPSAVDGAAPDEYPNLANTLYCETACEEHRRVTGERYFLIFNSYAASVASHRWPTGWAADFPAGCGLLNAGLSGQAMVSLDMANHTPAGAHYGFLTPFSIVDAWAYYKEPWLFPPHIAETARFYAKLRHRLGPYLYATVRQAHETGMPMMRAMVFDWPGDPAARDLTTQHMLGDWLLVGQERNVWLPRGTWIDFWTGRRLESAGRWTEVPFEEPAGGPLLAREGAIVPMKPVAAFLEEEPWELIVLRVFPGPKRSFFGIYEDDGRTYGYEAGAFARTEVSCQLGDGAVRVSVGERKGRFEGMCAARAYLVLAHTDAAPEAVRAGGKPLSKAASKEALLHGSDGAGWWFDDQDGTAWIKPESGWKLTWDRRGPAGDPERDTVLWSSNRRPSGAALEVECAMPSAKEAAGASESRRPRPRFLSLPWTSPEREVPPAPAKADRMAVMANPPERIALKWGDWLPYATTVHVTLMAGERIAHGAENEITLEALDAEGNVVQRDRKKAFRGRAEFPGLQHRSASGDHLFRLASPGLQPVEVRVRPAPHVPGRMK